MLAVLTENKITDYIWKNIAFLQARFQVLKIAFLQARVQVLNTTFLQVCFRVPVRLDSICQLTRT